MSYTDPIYIGEIVRQITSLDPVLIASVIEFESGGDPKATSQRGAFGLMQLMPDTWKENAAEGDSVDSPDDNVRVGARYLQKLFEEFKSVSLAVCAYNCGPGNLRKFLNFVPSRKATLDSVYVYLPNETRHYVLRILSHYADLKQGGA